MKRFDLDIRNFSYQELKVMRARQEAGKIKFPYASPFTLKEINDEMEKRNPKTTGQFTPGNWQFREQGEANEYCMITTDEPRPRWVASFRLNGEIATPDQIENCKLMAKAPAMYRALEEVLREAKNSIRQENEYTFTEITWRTIHMIEETLFGVTSQPKGNDELEQWAKDNDSKALIYAIVKGINNRGGEYYELTVHANPDELLEDEIGWDFFADYDLVEDALADIRLIKDKGINIVNDPFSQFTI